ncbi:MAG TPA: hypothetical protein VLR26_02355 [Frankiaceae bacterium]|nr:hypothetical protein [Frankiaceae bacterium]
MADMTPDDTDGGETPPTSGTRRAGLDRLRAARGGSSAGVPAGDRPADDAGGGSGSGSDSGSSSGERVSGSTALLESERATEATREIDGSQDADTATDTDTAAPAAPGRRARRGGRASGAGVASAGTSADKSRGRQTAGKASTAQATRSYRGRLIVALVLGLLVVGLLVPVIAMRHRIVGQSKEDKAVTSLVDKRVDALAAARRFTITFFSPDYKSVDSYNDTVSAAATGSWLNDFNGKKGQLKSLLTQVQSQATGHVLAAGVSKVSGNDVEVLLVVDQDVKNTTSKGKTVTNRYRVRLSMQKSAKGWLVTNLEPVV